VPGTSSSGRGAAWSAARPSIGPGGMVRGAPRDRSAAARRTRRDKRCGVGCGVECVRRALEEPREADRWGPQKNRGLD
jgi:hypothetical protein